jgi:hypothetical protein
MVMSALHGKGGRKQDNQQDHDCTLQSVAQLEECLAVLDDCRDVIETYAELKPFSVFGFKIEASTVFTVFSTGVSFFGVLFSLYSNAKANEGAA